MTEQGQKIEPRKLLNQQEVEKLEEQVRALRNLKTALDLGIKPEKIFNN